MVAVCGMSMVFVTLTILIAYYQYRVWWHCQPDWVYKNCRCCCCKQHFHSSHQGFLPSTVVVEYQVIHRTSNRHTQRVYNHSCQCTVSGNCSNRSLEHIAIFHAFDFAPHSRYRSDVDKTYVGFYRTTLDIAVRIAETGFHISNIPLSQTLGFGVNFVPSLLPPDGAEHNSDAYVCVEVSMGRARLIDRSGFNEVPNTDAWWADYDTIYYAHEKDNRDEFCVKDPSQILKWFIIVNDDRMRLYGLNHEYDGT